MEFNGTLCGKFELWKVAICHISNGNVGHNEYDQEEKNPLEVICFKHIPNIGCARI